MATWEPLKRNDLIDVVAPAWACTDEELQAGVHYLEGLGFRVRVPKAIFGKDLLCANTDAIRFEQLKKAVYSKDSKAIWCLRGGYGAIRLMPSIIGWKKPTKVKAFIGYSDITTLHSFFNQKWKWPTLHGPLLDRMGSSRPSVQERDDILKIIFGETKECHFDNLEALNSKARSRKNIRGVMVGGNLCVVASSVGTPNQLRGRASILFLEDTGERAYRIDRMMQQLQQSKSLDGLSALVLGDFLGGPDKDGVSRVWDFWNEYAVSAKFPVFKGLPVGHGEIQRTLPLGTVSVLHRGARFWSLKLPTGCR